MIRQAGPHFNIFYYIKFQALKGAKLTIMNFNALSSLTYLHKTFKTTHNMRHFDYLVRVKIDFYTELIEIFQTQQEAKAFAANYNNYTIKFERV